MNEVWIPLASGVVGAVIGSFSTVAVTLFNARAERRRELARLAVQTAIEDTRLETALKKQQGGWVPPLYVSVFYQAELLKLIEAGNLTPATISKVEERYLQIVKAIRSDSAR